MKRVKREVIEKRLGDRLVKDTYADGVIVYKLQIGGFFFWSDIDTFKDLKTAREKFQFLGGID